jgi:hypothetical protein
MPDAGRSSGGPSSPGGEPGDAELAEIFGDLEFFRQMNEAEELAAEKAWDATEPEPPEEDEPVEGNGNGRD